VLQEERLRAFRHGRPWVRILETPLHLLCVVRRICANRIPRSNAEEMLNEEGKPKTSHTTNKVPFVMANAPKGWSLKKTDGVLGDVAPTLLAAMGLEQPAAMEGHNLLVKS
jgi:hypothetical protein